MYLPFENKIKLLFSNKNIATEKELLKSNKISFEKSKKCIVKNPKKMVFWFTL